MLFLISGSAASGKTTRARRLQHRLGRVACHDADEMVAEDSDTRCAQLEIWVQHALGVQQRGQDFLLATNSPLGELLACPSAPLLDGIVACLLDCADSVRIDRMHARGIDPRWPPSQHVLNWGAWHRMHARDPHWEPHVIDGNGPPTHRYDRWCVFVLDTTHLSEDAVFDRLLGWVQTARTTPSLLSAATRWWTDEVEVRG